MYVCMYVYVYIIYVCFVLFSFFCELFQVSRKCKLSIILKYTSSKFNEDISSYNS